MDAPSVSQQRVTDLLVQWSHGDKAALAQLMPLVYEGLHRVAHHHLSRQRPGHTLQMTALVNEAYLRLTDQSLSRTVLRILLAFAETMAWQGR